jgi:hypothetical protein
MNNYASSVLALVLSLALAGCSGPGNGDGRAPTAPRNPGGSGSAEVRWQPDVHVIEQQPGLDALISVSTDGSVLVFDRTASKLPEMKAGEVLLIKGLMARKILAAETSGQELALLTVPAGLPDLVSDAKIRLRVPIRFGEAQALGSRHRRAAPWQMVSDAVIPTAHAQSPVAERAKAAEQRGRRDAYGNLAKAPFKAMLEGWDTEFSASPAPGRLNLSLQLKKQAAGVAAIVTGDGYLADFDFDADIDVQKSVVEKLQVDYRKLNGVMNFKWKVQTTDDGSLRGNAGMKLPAAIEIPLYQYLGGLPLFLEVSAAVLIKPGIGSEYSFSHGEFVVTYDGHQSFRAHEGVVDSEGQVSGDIKLLDSAGGSGPPTGIVLTFAAPRLELSLGVSKVLKFDGMKEVAAKADRYRDVLISKAFGAEALAKFTQSPLSKVTAGGVVDAAMGSDAAAYIQLVSSSGMSHSGSAVMVPCTRNDVFMSVKVGVSAQALGQNLGSADKEIYKKELTRVFPSNNTLCNSL